MKALTLWQPWATLIALGAKRFETRSWTTNYRGLLAIHAGRRRDYAKLQQCYPFSGPLNGVEVVYGKVVAICILDDTHQLTPLSAAMFPSREQQFGIYEAGRWVWKLKDIIRLRDPIPAMGAQKLWNWQPQSPEQLLAQLEESPATLGATIPLLRALLTTTSVIQDSPNGQRSPSSSMTTEAGDAAMLS